MHKTNAAVSDVGIGPLPLSPIMRWLLERGGSIGGFSQSMLLQVPTQLTEDQLIGAVQALLDHHDALRLRLVGSWESIGAGALRSRRRGQSGPQRACAGSMCQPSMSSPLAHAESSKHRKPRVALSPRPE